MSATDHDSGLDIVMRPMPQSAASRDDHPLASAVAGASLAVPADLDRQAADQGIVLNGEILACSCPDCGALMSIRLWLMVADCWRCGAGIELTERQERVARQLVARQRQQTPAPRPVASSSSPPQSPPRRSPPPQAPPPLPSRRQGPVAPPISQRPASWSESAGERSSTRTTSATSLWLVDLFKDLPAWLISLILHLILMIILGIWPLGDDLDAPQIILSTEISIHRSEGGVTSSIQKADETVLDLPADLPDDSPQRETLVKAHQAAHELRLDEDVRQQLPEINHVRSALNSPNPSRRMLAARDPRLRSEVVTHQGGTVWTEAAVARGLRWLARHQETDGSWSLSEFHRTDQCRGRCDGHGRFGKMAGTALALLPYLGAGQSPSLPCKYRDEVAKGLQWILKHQDQETGDLRGDTTGNGGMYVHGQATIVLCEAFALTSDETLRSPAQKAVDFIIASQHPAGGWRYRPGEAGDTSLLGWQLMALYSAKSATLTVPDHTLKLAARYLQTVESTRKIGLYSYRRGKSPSAPMTAEAILCRFYLGDKRDARGMVQGIRYLTNDHPPSHQKPNLYYWYYATQVMHHWGGADWDDWNRRIRNILLSSQERHGHRDGSWPCRASHDRQGGRLYATSLAICTLEVYYRHAPLFKQIDLRPIP